MEDDLTPEDQEIKKKCVAKNSKLRKANPRRTPRFSLSIRSCVMGPSKYMINGDASRTVLALDA